MSYEKETEKKKKKPSATVTANLDKTNLSEGGIVSFCGCDGFYPPLWGDEKQRFGSDSSAVQESMAGHEKPQVKSHVLGFSHNFLLH